MQRGADNVRRTRVYLDGYNLYFGCLKNTPHKWLDPCALIERILATVLYEEDGRRISYRFQEPAIKYFTASILQAFARSADSIACQNHYHSALNAHIGHELEIVKGYYDARPARAHAWEEGKAARECAMVHVWKLEEKQSDVALALHAFSDAIRREVDQIIAVTNDSDFVPAMKMIRQYTPAIIGLIAPMKPGHGNVNAELEKHAHWVRKHILDDEFAQSQLPSLVRVKGSRGAARKWLNQPCAHLCGRIPIDLCGTDETARELRGYMEQYAKEFGILSENAPRRTG